MSYIGLICSIFLIIFATCLFMPINFHSEAHIINLKPFNWIGNTDSFDKFVVEKIPNIMLFIPLGFFIPTVFKNMRKFWKTSLVAFCITFSIEFFQYFAGRSSDIDDIIMNLFGAIIGYALFGLFNRCFVRTKWWNRFLCNE